MPDLPTYPLTVSQERGWGDGGREGNTDIVGSSRDERKKRRNWKLEEQNIPKGRERERERMGNHQLVYFP